MYRDDKKLPITLTIGESEEFMWQHVTVQDDPLYYNKELVY